MATRFFVDGLVDADYSGTDNWSSSSGGSGGSSVPGTTDTAIFDGNSPALCTINTSSSCADLDMSAWTGVMTVNNSLKTYGDVQLSANTTLDGDDFLWFFETTAGGSITWNSADIQCGLKWGGTIGGTWTMQDDVTVTGTQGLIFQATSDTSMNTLNGQLQTEIITYNPASLGTVEHRDGTGSMEGTAIIKITGECNLRFLHSSTYWLGLTFEIATGGDVHIFGDSAISAVCAVGNTFRLTVTGSGTIDGDPATAPIPYFYFVDAGTAKVDFANLEFEHRVYFRASASTQSWYNDSAGTDPVARIQYDIAGTKRYYNNNGKGLVKLATDGVDGEIREFRGDAGILFWEYIYQFTVNSARTHSWQEGNIYEFRDRFKHVITDVSDHILQSLNATLTTEWYVWHNCRVNLEGCNFTRIHAADTSEAQTIYCVNAIITDCNGIHTEETMKTIKTGDGADHPFYTDDIINPVTVSGTVELSATPQANARVHIITRQTDPDGTDWFALRYVLTTNGSGEWTCSVPLGSTVFVSAHYDSGGTKYNSLSKPFISAT